MAQFLTSVLRASRMNRLTCTLQIAVTGTVPCAGGRALQQAPHRGVLGGRLLLFSVLLASCTPFPARQLLL